MLNNRWVSISGKCNTACNRAFPYVCAGLGVAVLFVLSIFPSYARSDNRHVEPRRLVRTTEATYVILQAGNEIGQEKVTRNDYSDNSIEYGDLVELKLSNGFSIVTDSELLVDEESRFPMRFRMAKTTVRMTEQDTTEFEHLTDIEWFSNVAVVITKNKEDVDTLRLVLPTGTAVMDINSVYHMYQPLYWHKDDLEGGQSFDVIDPGSKKLYSATLRKQATETITVAGKDIEAIRYEFTRAKQKATIFVDAQGRIVKADQGFLGYELSGWSETAPKNQ